MLMISWTHFPLRVCVCVCVFSFSSFGRSNVFTQNLLLLIFKWAWILWQQLNNNDVTKSMKLQNHFKLLHTIQTEMEKKMDLEPFFFCGVIFFSIWCETFFSQFGFFDIWGGADSVLKTPSKESLWYTFYIFLDQFGSTFVPRLVWQQAWCLIIIIIIIFQSFAFSSKNYYYYYY